MNNLLLTLCCLAVLKECKAEFQQEDNKELEAICMEDGKNCNVRQLLEEDSSGIS